MPHSITPFILSDIIVALSKNSKECVLDIRPNDLLFVVREETKKALPLIWCEMGRESVFAEYSFRGVSAENNQIVLIFNPVFLGEFTQIR